jgi:hypothetical protein
MYRKCDLHGSLNVSWDTHDIPDDEAGPMCYVCDMENKIICGNQTIARLEAQVRDLKRQKEDLEIRIIKSHDRRHKTKA